MNDHEARVYTPLDPTLRAYHHGVGTLRVNGELRGHLACVVREMGLFKPREPWPWFVVVWSDGTREMEFEDYGPGWWTVRELDDGRFEHYEQGVRKEWRLFGKKIFSDTRGRPCRYDFAWLSVEEAAKKWQELGLVDADF